MSDEILNRLANLEKAITHQDMQLEGLRMQVETIDSDCFDGVRLLKDELKSEIVASKERVDGLAALQPNPYGAAMENRITDLEDFKQNTIFAFARQEDNIEQYVKLVRSHDAHLNNANINHQKEIDTLHARFNEYDRSIRILHERINELL